MIRQFFLVLPVAVLAGCFSQPPAPAVDRSPSGQTKQAVAATVAPVVAGPGYYTVKRGDTLYRIAFDNGQDYRDLAAWNNIANPDLIKEGQVLRVVPENAAGGLVKPVASVPVVESRPLESSPLPAPQASSTAAVKKEPRAGKEPYSAEAYARLNNTQPEVVAAKPVEAKPEAKPESKSDGVAVGADDIAWAWPTGAKLTAPYNDASNKGFDFAGKPGDPVMAAADGKVVYAGSGLRGYGELVIIKHSANYLSAYGHNRKILVKEGQMVTRGQRIAEMGNTDADTVKLHFEIRKQGKPVDPAQYLPKR